MYVRQSAWLACVPEGSNISRYDRIKKGDTESPYLELPDIEGGEFYMELLHDLGFVRSSGFGVIGIDYIELEAFLRLHQLDLNSWEIGLLYKLSNEYAAQYNNSKDDDCPAPNTIEMTDAHRKRVEEGLKKVFNRFDDNKDNKPNKRRRKNVVGS